MIRTRLARSSRIPTQHIRSRGNDARYLVPRLCLGKRCNLRLCLVRDQQAIGVAKHGWSQRRVKRFKSILFLCASVVQIVFVWNSSSGTRSSTAAFCLTKGRRKGRTTETQRAQRQEPIHRLRRFTQLELDCASQFNELAQDFPKVRCRIN